MKNSVFEIFDRIGAFGGVIRLAKTGSSSIFNEFLYWISVRCSARSCENMTNEAVYGEIYEGEKGGDIRQI